MTNAPKPLRAIFFDVGDTLVFDKPSQIDRIHIAMRACGIDIERHRMDPAFRAVEDYALSRYVLGEGQDNPRIARRCIDILLEQFGLEALDDNRWGELFHAYDDVPYVREFLPERRNMLGAIKSAGFKIGVVSDWDAGLEQMLVDIGVRPYLDALAVSDIVGCTKPDPRIFRAALMEAGLAPEETVHIGDFYELDVAGARAAGMQAALFDWRRRSPDADCPRFTTAAGMMLFVREICDANPRKR